VNGLQGRTAKAIVNIFETGRVRGDYGAVTVLAGDSGHLTYGRSQTTLASGNLFLLVKAYCDQPDAKAELVDALRPFLERLANQDETLDTDRTLRDALKDAATDAVMRREQDRFFDRHYFDPACAAAAARGITSPLGTTVVYDSVVHGSFGKIAARVGTPVGPGGVDEKTWVAKYVAARAKWLREHPNALLRKCVYRMEAFDTLIQNNAWDLPLALDVRGVVISQATLDGASEFVRATAVDADDPRPPVILRLTDPHMRGDAVTRVQEAMHAKGFLNSRDGVYGPVTEGLVKQFQKAKGLRDDGVVGPATRAALGL